MLGARLAIVAGCILGLTGGPAAIAQEPQARQFEFKAPPHACDTLAANPLDPGRVTDGVPTAMLRAEAAIIACQEAVKLYPTEPRFQFQLGRAYRQANHIDEALRWYTAAAERGYAGAQNSLGVMYARGEGVAEDCTKAARYFQLAATQGYPAANDNLRTLACVRQV